MNFVDFIIQKASQCGWHVTDIHSNDLVSLNFTTDYGREICFIHPVGKNSDGNTMLEFRSVGLDVPYNRTDAGEMALVLMQRNGEMLIGSWCITKDDNTPKFIVSTTMIANTMDVDEFKSAVESIISERRWLHKMFQKVLVNF